MAVIEGFFYVAGSPDYKENEARDAYARFKEAYAMAPQVCIVLTRSHTHGP